MAFLGHFNEVVFEGHDRVEAEIERFREIGFDNIEKIGVSERQRTILHCQRSERPN